MLHAALPGHVHFLPVEDSPAVRITTVGVGTLAGETLGVHLTLDLLTYVRDNIYIK